MGKTLNKLTGNSKKKFTLTGDEVLFLQSVNGIMQQALEFAQQRIAADYLHKLAVSNFGYAPNCDLRFNFDPTKSADNLEIENVTK
jgi:hypothetical protein